MPDRDAEDDVRRIRQRWGRKDFVRSVYDGTVNPDQIISDMVNVSSISHSTLMEIAQLKLQLEDEKRKSFKNGRLTQAIIELMLGAGWDTIPYSRYAMGILAQEDA